MLGQMMDVPLLVSSLIVHADKFHGDAEIVSRTVEGPIHRYTYRDAHRRARHAAQMLARLGVQPGERAGTLAWNGFRHFELYYGASGSGVVLHTVNPRLFPEQLAWIINHAEDRVMFFDLSFAPLVDALAEKCPTVKAWIALNDRAHLPALKVQVLCYEDLLAAENGDYAWPQLDERSAAVLCYTSGTTGNPKGVVYSHRSTLLHAYGTVMPDVMNLSARDVVLPVVPMFHVNAWGIPYSAPMVGAKLVFPGPGLDGASLYELFESEGVTFSAGVPTVWLGLLQYLEKSGRKFTRPWRSTVGGSACPPALMEAYRRDHGVHVHHGWGMTEMSPLGTYCTLKNKHLGLTPAQQRAVEIKQGRPIFGVDLKIVDEDGRSLPNDGKAFGDLLVRGPWVIDTYFRVDDNPLRDGWFPTGDVATLDPDGYMQITDRSKDVIKSGGEWISSIDLENIAMSHPAVAEAAVIAARHAKWDERPLLIVVRKPGAEVTREEILGHFEGRIAKWWTPDDVVFTEEIPHTATGKISKLQLRQRFGEHLLAAAGAR
jgi:acyl-CoA synthetase (AMP-forming)/AMP-acid ligase II